MQYRHKIISQDYEKVSDYFLSIHVSRNYFPGFLILINIGEKLRDLAGDGPRKAATKSWSAKIYYIKSVGPFWK